MIQLARKNNKRLAVMILQQEMDIRGSIMMFVIICLNFRGILVCGGIGLVCTSAVLDYYPGIFSHNDTRISRLASSPGHSL